MENKLNELLNFSIINIDKPEGPTSFTVSDYVRDKLSKLGVTKTSHFGTLDPKVTGVLPIAIGRACKLTGFFLGHDKTYIGVIHTHKEQNIEELQKMITKNFVGKIKQTPPKKSAVKRAERIREVKKWDLIEQGEGEEKDRKNFLFIVEVEGGTYIRKLCSDLGEIIGGAHMLELRRIKAGIFSEEDKMISLYDFDKAIEEFKKGNEKELEKYLIPAEEAIKKIMPNVKADERALRGMLTGKPIFKEDILKEDQKKIPNQGSFAIFSKSKFIEIAKVVDEGRVIARPEFVFN
jgi:H/ACA ribonucleoprotein complex subunit 4